jgi:CubicO group peptidase (beta-lactamase class C family)
MMNAKYIFYITFFLTSTQSIAQENFNSLDSIFNLYEKDDDFNGTVLIARNGVVSYRRSIGYADFGNQIKLNTTPMHLASITKTFTVMGTMILKERGLLNYDDKVKKYLTTIPYDNLTIRHLMTSTSGLKRLYNKAANDYGIITIQNMIDYCSNKKPKLSFVPGEKFQSSVAGYCLLAGVIEITSGKSYSQFLEDEIFKPLNMNNTFLLAEDSWNLPRAISYDRNNKEKEWLLGSYNGGIGIYASAHDLLIWDQALYSEKLVSQETIANAYERMQLNDGSHSHVTVGGWMRWKGQENLIFKNGDWVANNSILFRDIENNTTVIIMNNRENRITKFDIMDIVLPELGYSW